MASRRERERKAPQPGDGQLRIDLAGNISVVTLKKPGLPKKRSVPKRTDFGIVPNENKTISISSKPDRLNTIVKERPVEKKPIYAYVNGETLKIIRSRIRSKYQGYSDNELAENLLVFQGRGKTNIEFEKRDSCSTILLSSVIAVEFSSDPDNTPLDYKMYELLGIFTQPTGTGKPGTDRAVSKYARIQRKNMNHPSTFEVGLCFFARPEDAIKVRVSQINETCFFYGSQK